LRTVTEGLIKLLPGVDRYTERKRHMGDSKRWYDEIPELREQIERLKHVGKEKRDKIFDGIKQLESDFDSKLIDLHVLEFPMNLRRRWYDQDPTSWLMINALKYADRPLLQRIIDYLKLRLHE
jgi:hypothetical protein